MRNAIYLPRHLNQGASIRWFCKFASIEDSDSGPTLSTTSAVPTTCPDPLRIKAILPRIFTAVLRISQVFRPERMWSM